VLCQQHYAVSESGEKMMHHTFVHHEDFHKNIMDGVLNFTERHSHSFWEFKSNCKKIEKEHTYHKALTCYYILYVTIDASLNMMESIILTL
jgi:hypothetical protein